MNTSYFPPKTAQYRGLSKSICMFYHDRQTKMAEHWCVLCGYLSDIKEKLNGRSISMSENIGSRKITTIYLIYYFIYLFLETKSIVVIIRGHGITTDSF